MGVVGAGRARSHSGALRHERSGQDLGLPLPLPLMRHVRHVRHVQYNTVTVEYLIYESILLL